MCVSFGWHGVVDLHLKIEIEKKIVFSVDILMWLEKNESFFSFFFTSPTFTRLPVPSQCRHRAKLKHRSEQIHISHTTDNLSDTLRSKKKIVLGGEDALSWEYLFWLKRNYSLSLTHSVSHSFDGKTRLKGERPKRKNQKNKSK